MPQPVLGLLYAVLRDQSSPPSCLVGQINADNMKRSTMSQLVMLNSLSAHSDL